MSRKLFIIITMMFLGLSWLTSPALADHEVQLALANPTTPKVVFRLDDIQDWYCNEAQQEIIKVFADYSVDGKSSPQGISIGIIGNVFGEDVAHVEEIQEIMANLGDSGEVVSHSMTHEDFSEKTIEEQVRELEDFRELIGDTYFPEKEVRTFIAPFNAYSEDTTIPAMKEAGYDILSAQCTPNFCYNEGDPTSNPAYLPAAASTGGWDVPYKIQPASEIFAEIQEQIEINNWSVVMMHPFEFTMEDPDDTEVNPDAIETLRELIGICLDNGYEVVTYSQLVDSVLSSY
ncbi:MAG: polysaccharide deacetylase family protein [Okeania sp. SIO3I5]|uniref:polysaccharide deacetylase family protein n=1 Tax=Okeania sp. SIO3I5 TaxID=2607805 RepID=UPI0013BD331A|nr:polysaccharide deacetylase family protein [Okeania sp. SIO3I5]NEQ40573.1 polysaccharide deacetylase family protein [Okeania sp. SIO3I5]